MIWRTMCLRLLLDESADALCLRQSGRGGRQKACLETTFRAGSCCLRGGAGDPCRSSAYTCHRGTRRHLRDDRDDLDVRSGWDDPNYRREPGHPDVRDALACRLYPQSWDARAARSLDAADGWFPLRPREFLRRGGSCHDLQNRSARDGGSRLRGAAGDLSMACCGRGRAFGDHARRSCRVHALRRRDAVHVGARLASRAESRWDLPLLPRSGWAHSVRDQRLLRWNRQRGRPSPLLPRSRAAIPQHRTARRRRAKRRRADAW
jgi:hypothetical protein